MFANSRDVFLKELEDYMREVVGLKERSIKIYLSKLRKVLESGYSVGDLCGAAEQLWEQYGPAGQRYDPKDHGNTRAAIKHVANLVRAKLLEDPGCPYVSYSVGWDSFRPVDLCESGYTIQDGVITFSYNKGFAAGKNVSTKIPTADIKKLIYIFERAQALGCLSSSDACIHSVHGNRYTYDYSFKDNMGSNCRCLFEGDTANVRKLRDEYDDLIQKLRP